MPFRPNWHADAISDHLEAVTRGDIRNLVINIPPGHAKSIIVGVVWPAWVWIDWPEWRALFSSYDLSLVTRDAVRCREIITDNWYREQFDPRWKLTGDQNVKTFYKNTRQGFRFCHTVAGRGTGHRGDAIVVDDPLNAKDRHSPRKRNNAIDWWDHTMPTRLNDPATGVKVIIMQRLHDEDLTGHCERLGNYEMLILPSLYEPERRARTFIVPKGSPQGTEKTLFFEDPRTVAGELLFPTLFTQQVLDDLTKVLGRDGMAAQHQQRPSPPDGSVFKAKWFERRYTRLPEMVEVWDTWDTALKDEEENDETACIVWGRGIDGFCYVIRVLHGRWETPDTAKFLVAQSKWLKALYGDRYRGSYVEDKVSGTTLMQYLRRENPDVIVIGIRTGRESKLERAYGVTPLCESERVLLPCPTAFPATRASVGDLMAQLLGFPNGCKHDDLLDVFVYGTKRFLGTLKTGKARSRRGNTQAPDS